MCRLSHFLLACSDILGRSIRFHTPSDLNNMAGVIAIRLPAREKPSDLAAPLLQSYTIGPMKAMRSPAIGHRLLGRSVNKIAVLNESQSMCTSIMSQTSKPMSQRRLVPPSDRAQSWLLPTSYRCLAATVEVRSWPLSTRQRLHMPPVRVQLNGREQRPRGLVQ